jgi:putative membrane protein
MLLHIIHLLVTAVAVLVAARIVPGIRVKSFGSAVAFAFVLAVLDVLLHKLLIILTLPFVLITFGLFLIVINGFLFWLADKVVEGVEVDGFGSAILGSLFTSLVSWAMMLVLVHPRHLW